MLFAGAQVLDLRRARRDLAVADDDVRAIALIAADVSYQTGKLSAGRMFASFSL